VRLPGRALGRAAGVSDQALSRPEKGRSVMADSSAERISELIKPLRVEVGSKVDLGKDSIRAQGDFLKRRTVSSFSDRHHYAGGLPAQARRAGTTACSSASSRWMPV